MTHEQVVPDAEAMQALGGVFACACDAGSYCIYLVGELGTGKTTWVRGFLRGLGYSGAVKSPSFTLLEQYELPGRSIVHLDLYRVVAPGELEWIGIRDWLNQDTICLVEWPERGTGMLPEPDLVVELRYGHPGRRFRARGQGPRGRHLLTKAGSHVIK